MTHTREAFTKICLANYFVHDLAWTEAFAHGHTLTSALVGIQLNDSMKYLEIIPPDRTNPNPPSPPTPFYKIRTRPSTTEKLAAGLNMRAIKAKKLELEPAAILLKAGNYAPVITPPQQMHSLPPSSMFTALAAIGLRDHQPPTTHPSNTDPSTPPTASSPPPASSPSATHLPLRIALGASGGTNLTIIRSAFTYTVYPREIHFDDAKDPKVRNGGFVFSDARSLSDLVFSVRLDPTTANNLPTSQQLRLRTIQFSIPLGPKIGRPVGVPSPGLAPLPSAVGWGGAGAGWRARMLGNQRWVAVVDPSTTFLTVRSIARSMAECEPLVATPPADAKGRIRSNCSEMGFLLAGVDTGWLAEKKKTGWKDQLHKSQIK